MKYQTVLDMWDDRVRQTPNKVCYIYREKKLTYKDVGEAMRRLAAHFHAQGIKKGDTFGIVLRNSPEFVVTWFALARLGAIAVPVNFLINKPEELAYIFAHAQTVGCVTQTEFLRTIQATQKLTPKMKYILVTDMDKPSPGLDYFWDAVNTGTFEVSGFNFPAPFPDDVATYLYTSGTTGVPKGVMLTHKNLTSNALAAAEHLELTHKDRFLCILPMFHTFAWTAKVLIPIFLGCPVVIVESIRPPKPWLKMMMKYGVTVFGAVPQIYAVLGEEAKGFKRWVLKYLFFRKVRFCVSGAAPLSPEVQKKFEDRLGVPILQGYGLTETSPVTHAGSLKANKPGTVGKTIPGVFCKIIDENGRELPQGQEGEICVKGPNIMKGYYKMEKETQETFTKDDWLKTGDIGVIDPEGFLTIKDRKKDMIIVKGLKVFPAMIEAVLAEHSAVAESAVIGIPETTGDEIIKAFVVLKDSQAVDKSVLMKLLRSKLAPYQTPRDIEFRKELPKNALQKILKKDLRKEEMEKLKLATSR